MLSFPRFSLIFFPFVFLYFSFHHHSHLSLPFPSIIFSEFLSFILNIIYPSFHLSFSFPVYSFTFFQRIRTNVGSMNVPYKYQVTSGSYALHSPPVTSLCLLTAKPYDIYSYQFCICWQFHLRLNMIAISSGVKWKSLLCIIGISMMRTIIELCSIITTLIIHPLFFVDDKSSRAIFAKKLHPNLTALLYFHIPRNILSVMKFNVELN